jgi:hypothetical protein
VSLSPASRGTKRNAGRALLVVVWRARASASLDASFDCLLCEEAIEQEHP